MAGQPPGTFGHGENAMTSVPCRNRDRSNGRVVSTPRNQLSHKQSRLIRIENPIPGRSPFTNRNAAQRMVDRGRAKWTDGEKSVLRFLDEAQVVLQRQVRSEIAREAAYWREVAAQRGGEEVAFHWHPSISNGYVVMGATPIAFQKRAQIGPRWPGQIKRNSATGLPRKRNTAQHGRDSAANYGHSART